MRVKRTKSIKGGAVFNQTMDFAKVSGGTDNAFNNYGGDVSRAPFYQSSRLFLGGKRRPLKKRMSRQMGKMRGGGSGFVPDPLGSFLGPNQLSNPVFAFGTLPGASWISKELSGLGNIGGPTTTYNPNGPIPPLV